MAGINHLHSDEPQPNLRHRCSRQQLAKGAASRRLTVDLGDEVAHAKTGGVASASLDYVGNLVVVGDLGSTEIPSVPPLRLSVKAQGRASSRQRSRQPRRRRYSAPACGGEQSPRPA